MISPEDLSSKSLVAVVAAAGCGKTHLLSSAVAACPVGRQLVLTHTNAGVKAIKNGLQAAGVSVGIEAIDTISGWALKYALSFPKIGAISPAALDLPNWEEIYRATTAILANSNIQDVIRATYSGLFVDEYQDCTRGQHGLILALSRILPTRVLGDPLQGIFDFPGTSLVDWKRDIVGNFEVSSESGPSWRWVTTNPSLGEWVEGVRTTLLRGGSIDLRSAPVNLRIVNSPDEKRRKQVYECMSLGRKDERACAIHKMPAQCRDVARSLQGLYNCIESGDCPDLIKGARNLDHSKGFQRAVHLIDIAAICMTKVSQEMRTIREALSHSRIPSVRNGSEQLAALRCVIESDSPVALVKALDCLSQIPGAFVYRKELMSDLRRSMVQATGPEPLSLEEGARQIRARSRRLGRQPYNRSVGTTLLVKGLEFENVVILDAQAVCNEPRHAYVALTRAKVGLTIISTTPNLGPFPPSPDLDIE